MSNSSLKLAATYFRQQAELSIPDYIFYNTKQVEEHYPHSKKGEPEQQTIHEASGNYGHSGMDTREQLIELYNEVKECCACDLSKSRRNMVFGSGNASAPLMVIGEAPGYDEDQQGKPFVGKAGALLTKMLAAINIDRTKDAFITNILKCRPPENRNPNQVETVACVPILKRQISIIAPSVILLLGRIAVQELLMRKESIGQLRSEIHTYNSIPVVVTYHPAALLRNVQYKRPAWEDLQKLQSMLREKGLYGNNEN